MPQPSIGHKSRTKFSPKRRICLPFSQDTYSTLTNAAHGPKPVAIFGDRLMTAHKPTLMDWGMVLALALLWGMSFPMISVAVKEIPPLTFAVGRMGAAGGILFLYIVATGVRLPRDLSSWLYMTFVGIIGTALPFILFPLGQKQVPAGTTGILNAVMPLITIVLAHFFVNERLTTRKVAGFVLGFCGVVVLIGPEALLALGGDSNQLLSQLIIVSGSACYAMSAIASRKLGHVSALITSAVTLTMGAVVTLPIALIVDEPFNMTISAEAWGAAAYMAFAATLAATLIYFKVVGRAGPSFFSQTNYLVPVVAVIGGVILLGEPLHPNSLVAFALVLGGLFISRSTPKSA